MTKINQWMKISALYLGTALCIFTLSRGLMFIADREAWYYSTLGITSAAATLIVIATIPLVLIGGLVWISISAAKYVKYLVSESSQAKKDG